MNSETINAYSELLPIYEGYNNKLHYLLEELLTDTDIKYHLIESRVKNIASFQEKISRPSKLYNDPLNEIDDISGIRIIVYYSDDIQRVAELIEQEFEKIECENSHQPENYSPDSFGYLSLHYVVKINQQRLNLKEWARYSDFKSEIQIRTVLQHSWAAISHALQYKNENDVPKPLRRKLFRLAGLFELADEEFISVRNQAVKNKSEIKQSIVSGNTDIDINSISLQEFMESWGGLNDLYLIMDKNRYTLEADGYDDEDDLSLNYYGTVSAQCERVGLTKISQLSSLLNLNFEAYLSRIHIHHSEWKVSNSFMLYLLLIRAKIEKFTVANLENAGWFNELAKTVIKVAKEDKKANK